jgi:hypothetical protein
MKDTGVQIVAGKQSMSRGVKSFAKQNVGTPDIAKKQGIPTFTNLVACHLASNPTVCTK